MDLLSRNLILDVKQMASKRIIKAGGSETFLLTYLLTYLLHGAGSFLRS